MPKNIVIITIAAVVLIVLGGAAAYITSKQGGEELRPESPVVALPEGLDNTKTIDASDWKTYRDEKYGFELKYPRDLVIRDFTKIPKVSFPLALGFGSEDSPYDDYYDQPPFINLYVSINEEPVNIDELVKMIDFPVVKREIVIISGVKALKSYNGPNSVMNVMIPDPKNNLITYSFVPSATFDKDLSIFNGILSTFKFIK